MNGSGRNRLTFFVCKKPRPRNTSFRPRRWISSTITPPSSTRRRKATNVIKKTYIKSTLPGAKKIRTRKVKEAAAKLNQERRLAILAEKARARANQLAAARRETVGMGVALGPRGKLTPAAKSTPASSIPKPSTVSNRAQEPTVVLPRTTGLSENARARLTTVVEREVSKPKTGGVQSRLGKTLKGLSKR